MQSSPLSWILHRNRPSIFSWTSGTSSQNTHNSEALKLVRGETSATTLKMDKNKINESTRDSGAANGQQSAVFGCVGVAGTNSCLLNSAPFRGSQESGSICARQTSGAGRIVFRSDICRSAGCFATAEYALGIREPHQAQTCGRNKNKQPGAVGGGGAGSVFRAKRDCVGAARRDGSQWEPPAGIRHASLTRAAVILRCMFNIQQLQHTSAASRGRLPGEAAQAASRGRLLRDTPSV